MIDNYFRKLFTLFTGDQEIRLIIGIAYLIASIFFIMGLKFMSSPRTARRGMFLAEAAMGLAIVTTLLDHEIVSLEWILLDLVRDPTVRDTMEDAGRRAIVSPRSIDPELLPVALRIAARRGDAKLAERLDKQRRVAATPQLERHLLLARADFEDPTLVRHLLEDTITDSIRSQDLAFVYMRLFRNPAARWHAWHFLQHGFEALNARAITYMWKRIADAIPELGTPEALKEVRTFFAKHPLPDTDQGMQQALEWMTLDLAFRRRARAQVERWLGGVVKGR